MDPVVAGPLPSSFRTESFRDPETNKGRVGGQNEAAGAAVAAALAVE
jgi:hypothetical protein